MFVQYYFVLYNIIIVYIKCLLLESMDLQDEPIELLPVEYIINTTSMLHNNNKLIMVVQVILVLFYNRYFARWCNN